MNSAGLASLLQRFFTQRLLEQQGVSSDTVASYRDTFRLLLRFATQHLGRAPSKLLLDELDGIFIEKFLRHLERDRGNSVRTRNTRLAAIHAFFRFVAISEPAIGLQCQRILRSQPNAASMVRSSFSRRTRSRPSWRTLIRKHGLGAEIARCFLSQLKPDFAITSSPHSSARTLRSVPERTSAVSAKAERCDARHSARTSWRS